MLNKESIEEIFFNYCICAKCNQNEKKCKCKIMKAVMYSSNFERCLDSFIWGIEEEFGIKINDIEEEK